jgi:hypothetical protein
VVEHFYGAEWAEHRHKLFAGIGALIRRLRRRG